MTEAVTEDYFIKTKWSYRLSNFSYLSLNSWDNRHKEQATHKKKTFEEDATVLTWHTDWLNHYVTTVEKPWTNPAWGFPFVTDCRPMNETGKRFIKCIGCCYLVLRIWVWNPMNCVESSLIWKLFWVLCRFWVSILCEGIQCVWVTIWLTFCQDKAPDWHPSIANINEKVRAHTTNPSHEEEACI